MGTSINDATLQGGYCGEGGLTPRVTSPQYASIFSRKTLVRWSSPVSAHKSITAFMTRDSVRRVI